MGDADVPVPVLESAPVPRACGTGFLVAVGRPGDRRSAVRWSCYIGAKPPIKTPLLKVGTNQSRKTPPYPRI